MLSVLLAAAVGTSAVATPCPADLLVANPRLRVVRSVDAAFDAFRVTVDITNRGTGAQPADTRQHLALVHDGRILGTQTVPSLGGSARFAAAFRVQVPHQPVRAPFTAEFRYVLDSKNAPQANCTSVNDRLTATL